MDSLSITVSSSSQVNMKQGLIKVYENKTGSLKVSDLEALMNKTKVSIFGALVDNLNLSVFESLMNNYLKVSIIRALMDNVQVSICGALMENLKSITVEQILSDLSFLSITVEHTLSNISYAFELYERVDLPGCLIPLSSMRYLISLAVFVHQTMYVTVEGIISNMSLLPGVVEQTLSNISYFFELCDILNLPGCLLQQIDTYLVVQ